MARGRARIETMAQDILLIRHGSMGTEHDGRFIGRTDLPLSENGRHEAGLVAEALLRRARPSLFMSSPQRRALDTAQGIAEAWASEMEIEPDLREVDFGRWEGKSFEEIAGQDPGLVDQWARHDPEFSFPEGEGLSDFLSRVRRVLRRVRDSGAETVLLVTHGGMIRGVICEVLGLDPSDYLLFEVGTASITTLRLFGEKGVLVELNNRSHLNGIVTSE